MELLNFGYLDSIEKGINNFSDLKLFSEKTLEKYEKLQEISSVLEGLKTLPKFKNLVQEQKKLEIAENLLASSRMIKSIIDLTDLLMLKVSQKNCEFEAVEIIKNLESKKCVIDSINSHSSAIIAKCKKSLQPIFFTHLSEIIKHTNWPFRSKGEMLSVNQQELSKFKAVIKILIDFNNIHEVSEILENRIKDIVSYNFLSDQQTNRIEKPEWMFNYVINILRVNLCMFLASVDIPSQAIELILDSCITHTVQLISERINYDINSANNNNKETLFLHIIDEIIKFDLKLRELKSKVFVMEFFLSKSNSSAKFVAVWISYEKLYITEEIAKIISKDSWELNNITDFKFNSVTEIILLHKSLMIKYSDIAVEEIKNQLVESMNSVIFKVFIEEYTKMLDYLNTIINYESNSDIWNSNSLRLSSFHQSLVIFQQFVLGVDRENYADVHFQVNSLKKNTINKILNLFMYTLKGFVDEYVNSAQWDKKGFLGRNVVKKMVKDFKKNSTSDIFRTTLSYASQMVAENIVNGIQKKKNKVKENEVKTIILQDLKGLFKLLQDDSDCISLIEKKINSFI